ncbi:hypothetical protein KGQ27_03280 [Patescibacteria group bacterium]|nr:hypothetical protein [Patescibacteria group bacterium]MDE1946717.1 hypothetical protein [Patescibacteria group bacterium]MDE2010980.1 hypothetical protein [Patescibacteria group bacterium]MDE2232823.1 hypothetical protein [Patescibacteria group bacterium]
MNIVSLALSLVVAFGMFSAKAAQSPTVGDSAKSTAPGANNGNRQPKGLIGAGSPVIVVTPVLLAAQPSASWAAGADMVIADALAGGLKSNTAVTNPSDYAVCNHHIGWQNLVYSTGAYMWDGMLNPVAPFNAEYGHVVWALVDARSGTGNDDLSLDMLQVVTASNDGNALGGTNGFSGDNYTARAVAVKKDGTVVESGTASQEGVRVLVLVQSPLFNNGGTQAGLDQVKSWVMSQGNYSLTYVAEVVGNNATASAASVTVNGGVPSVNLRFMPNGQLSVVAGDTDRTYVLYSTATLPGVWKFAGTLNGTNAVTVQFTNTAMFFKAVAQ